MPTPIHGERSHLTLASETTWGVTPGSPVYVHVPVTNYTVTVTRERRNAAAFLGVRERRHGRSLHHQCAGRLDCPLYGWYPSGLSMSLAEYLLGWAFAAPDETELPSKLAEWAEGPNVANVRQNGLRVQAATLSGTAESGTISLELELIGPAEAALASAQTLPANRHRMVDFEFPDVSVTLDESALPIAAFRLRIENSLRPTFLNAATMAHLSAGPRIVSLQLTPIKSADTYSAWQRATTDLEKAGQIVLRGLHNGSGPSGAMTVATLDFPRLAFVNADAPRPLADLYRQPLRFEVLKPDDTDPDLTITWSTA